MHFDWAYDGVNSTVPRNAGPECRNYLSPTRIIIECICVTFVCILAIRYSWSNIIKKKSLPDYNLLEANSRATNDLVKLYHQQTTVISDNNSSHNNGSSSTVSSTTTTTTSGNNKGGDESDGTIKAATTTTTIHHYYERVSTGKQILLVVMTLILGLELGFKFASRSVVYILNPCHIITMIQIYILAAKPSKTITILFRIQMNYLNGPLLAFVFPETDSRQFTLEASTYWIQHALMWIIPIYLLRLGGVYNMEAVTDFNWNILSYAILMIYHFVILQIVAVPIQINLNHMLCPAILDPFEGPNYRLFAILHQGILCPLLCKLICIIFMPRSNQIYHETKTSNNNNQHLLERIQDKQYAHSTLTSKSNNSPTTTTTTTNTTVNGNHTKNLVNSIMHMNNSDIDSKKNCAASEMFLTKEVKID
uniref:CSON014525 protein n=1 Tax=Culicoides sonorensis TaxID=179676 RepID=A0A336MF62_CULSO